MLGYLASHSGFIGDAHRISLIGSSAGGHLALMAGLVNSAQFINRCEWGSSPYTIKSVAAISPPVDLNTLYSAGNLAGRSRVALISRPISDQERTRRPKALVVIPFKRIWPCCWVAKFAPSSMSRS